MSDYDQATQTILHWFSAISQIPRKSGNEEQIRQWLLDWAKEHGCGAKTDTVGNVVIQVPASAGYEQAPIVVLQGHMDMVCERTKDSTHDFSKDPIQLVHDGEWLKAKDTTLGADNGIAIAMALAVVDGDFPHPPIELLFTVDEETGLTGAQALEPGFIEGKILLNLDSEDEGVFTVGCAGGRDTELAVPVEVAAIPDGYTFCNVIAGGMSGGHSGVDIHEQRANAIKVLTRGLGLLARVSHNLRVISVAGGTAHNAIPRDAEAVIALPTSDVDRARALAPALESILKAEFSATDPRISFRLEEGQPSASGTTPAGTGRLVDFLLAVPDGVFSMSADIDGLVETSNNLAEVALEGGTVKVLTSQRSSSMARLTLLTDTVEAVGRLAGGTAESDVGYPSWKPNMDSPLLAQCIDVFKGLFDREPVIEIIHAGLECGLIGDRYPGMDMISFGPTIKNPHCPDEKLHMPSVGLVWQLLVELLGSIK